MFLLEVFVVAFRECQRLRECILEGGGCVVDIGLRLVAGFVPLLIQLLERTVYFVPEQAIGIGLVES